MMLRSLLYVLTGLAVSTASYALMTKVESGSKYPVVVMVFQGSCDLNKSALDKFTQASKNKGMMNKLRGMAEGLMEGEGCANAGNEMVLREAGDDIDVSEGEKIVAFKDPVLASKMGKVVNPLPAICTVQRGKTIYLNTRKSEGLRSVFGMAGDGGLMCSDTPPRAK